MELFVILAASQAPDVPAWNRALEVAQVPVVLSEEIDLQRHTGFLPVTMNGKGTGFYFLLDSYAELASHFPAVAALKLERPVVYSLGYGGDLHECAAVFYSASALVARFGGTAFEPQGGVVMSAEDLLAAAKECESGG
jgi:hypothetical protein